MAKKARFGDLTVGEVKEATAFNVSYSVVSGNRMKMSGTIGVVVKGDKEMAGKRGFKRLVKRWPEDSIRIRMIWKPGETPSGLVLPKGTAWVDDEVKGKKQNP